MHLNDERLQRRIDGELTPAEEAAVLEHLEICVPCAEAMREAVAVHERASALLVALDQPIPEMDFEPIMVRASEEATAPVAWSAPRTFRHPRPAWVRRVGVLAFAVLLAGAAFAIPGSPVPRWIRSVVERLRREPATRVVPGPALEDSSAGIAVSPGPSLVIEFRIAQPGGTAEVRLSDDAELQIRAPGGAASFTSDVDRVRVDSRGAASFEIELPRGAPHVEIRVGGATVFVKDGSRITGAPASSQGNYSVPLTPR